MSAAIAEFKLKIPEFTSLRDWWDGLKIEIRKLCVSFSVCKHRSTNTKRLALTKQLVRAKNIHHASQCDPSLISDLECQLSSLVSKEAEGAKIRSSVRWFEEGEKPTRYFFCLEQKRAASNSFTCLFDENGVEKSSQQDLENIPIRFYQKLFTADSLDMQIQTALIDDLGFSHTDCERERCEGAFTLDELLAALNGLRPEKHPALTAFLLNSIFASGMILVNRSSRC